MDFTFGIITTKMSNQYLDLIIDSINRQSIPNYEIIIVGDCNIKGEKIKIIDFDETQKAGWITRKKNIICQQAKYENIVLIHDYIYFEDGWYEGFLNYGNNFNFCVSCIQTRDKKRFRDHVIFPCGIETFIQKNYLIPYGFELPDKLKKLLYISGAYYIIKRNIALKYPLNENLFHMAGEDVELSQRLAKNNILVSFNPHSIVTILKNKDQCNWEQPLTSTQLEVLQLLPEELINELFNKQMSHIQENYLNKYK